MARVPIAVSLVAILCSTLPYLTLVKGPRTLWHPTMLAKPVTELDNQQLRQRLCYSLQSIFHGCCSRCRFQAIGLHHHHHPLRGVDSVHLQILLMGTCRQCGSWSVDGHNHRKVTGQDPFVQVSTTWALTCPETVHQRPRMMTEIETWLSDSKVGNNSVDDHRSQQPVRTYYTFLFT